MSSFAPTESIFSSIGNNRPIPTQPISQIIDLNHEKEKPEETKLVGFERQKTKQNFFQPNDFKNHRSDFTMGIKKYNAGQSQRQYFNEGPQSIPDSKIFMNRRNS